MSALTFLVDRFHGHLTQPAVITPSTSCTFGELLELVDRRAEELRRLRVGAGDVVGLEAGFFPAAVATFLALVGRQSIIAPQSVSNPAGADRELLAQVTHRIHVDGTEDLRIERTGRAATHDLYLELASRRHPGLVMFSSGTTGEPKVAVHDLMLLFEKFHRRRPALRTLAFLSFDHLGGLNTMLHTLSNGAALVSARDRSPETVCAAIERDRVELLPATPTFFNLLLTSGVHRRHDLSSLRVISYGAEAMPATTLERLHAAFPSARIQQTYGMNEVGVMRTKSRQDGSLWVKVGGEGYQTRVVDGELQIQARSMFIGYLNSPTPVTSDGWLRTGDMVDQDGEWLRFLGRDSDLINVGGEKVYPAEVESVIQSMAEVEDARVHGQSHGLIGEIVCAQVKLRDSVGTEGFAAALKRHCRKRLDRFKVPVRVEIVDDLAVGDRFKKLRHSGGPAR